MTDLAAIRIPVDTSDIPKAIQIVNKLQTELVSFEKAVRSGTLTTFSQNAAIAKSAKQLEALGYSYWEAKGAVNSFAQGLKTLNDVQLAQAGRGLNQSQQEMRNFELGVQQAGYQIGDFAVQVQSGTSPLVAFSQQFSQLAGFFGGPWGAAVGAAAAVLSGLALAFWDTRTASQAFKESLDSAEESLQNLRDAQSNFSLQGVEDLAEKYGEVDAAVNRLIQSELRLAEIRANSAIDDVVNSLQDMSRWYDIGISDAASSMLALREMFNLSKNDAESLYRAIEDIGQAQGFDQKADALAKVNQYLAIVLSAQEDVTDEQLQMAENFIKAESLARQFANSAPSEGWMDAAIKGVQGVIDKLKEALGIATQMGGPNVDVAGNPIVVPAGAKRPARRAPTGEGGIDWGLAPESKKGGGGPKESALEKLQKQLDLEKELVGTSEAYQRVRRALGEDFATTSPKVIEGLIAQVEYNEQLIELEKQREQLMNRVESSLENGFMAMVEGTKSVKDAFKQMAYEIIKELYRVLVVQRLVGGITGNIGMFTGASTGSFGLPFGRESGGTMMAGKPYLVGERGPELVIPRHSGTVVNANQTAGVLGNNSGATVVNNNISVTGSDAAMVRAEVAKMIPQITNATKAAVIDAKQRGGQMAAAFR